MWTQGFFVSGSVFLFRRPIAVVSVSDDSLELVHWAEAWFTSSLDPGRIDNTAEVLNF